MAASTRLWIVFKTYRVLIFAISTVLAMALAAIFAIFLVREWRYYSSAQRSILVIILVIDGCSTILLYLMIIVRFRLWLDGARIMSLVVFQAGATVAFSVAKSTLPCNNLGSVQACKAVTTAAVFGGWSLTALLLFYALCLAVMSHVPRPPPSDPESNLTESRLKLCQSPAPSWNTSTDSKSWATVPEKRGWNDEKRLSNSSSEGSQASWVGPPLVGFPTRSTSLASRDTIRAEQYGVYRPDTPQTLLSPSASSISSSRYTGTQLSYYDSYINLPPRVPSPTDHYTNPIPPSPLKARPPLLPNPFMDPLSRSGTPASVASFRSDGFLYTPPRIHARNHAAHIPRSLLVGGWQAPLQARYFGPTSGFLDGTSGENYVSPALDPDLVSQRLRNNSTPLTLHAGSAIRDTSESLNSSDDQMTVVSRSASIQSPFTDRSGSSLSVPRSPSPHNLPIHMVLPTSPKALVLPAHPRLYPVNLRGPQRFQEVRRFGSIPDLRMDRPFPAVKQATSTIA